MSLGWYSILFFVISLPGLLFRRTYYWGAFTAQYKAKNFILSIFYSMLIGILIVYLSLYVFNNSVVEFFKWSKITNKTFDNLITQLNSSTGINYIIKLLDTPKVVKKLITLVLLVFSISALLGAISFKIVRLFKLDIIIPFLKFSNHWHYYFRGEFLKFKEFNSTKNKAAFVYADILSDKGNGETVLYHGIVSQYELDKHNSNQLDTIHLTNPGRYKGKESSEIKSDCLILPYSRVLNINLRVAEIDLSDRSEKIDNWIKILLPLFTLVFAILPFFLGLFKTWQFPWLATFLLGNTMGTIPMLIKEIFEVRDKNSQITMRLKKLGWNILKLLLTAGSALIVYSLIFGLYSLYNLIFN